MFKVSCRQIAKFLLAGMDIEDEVYALKVEEYTKTIEAMPLGQQAALKAAYIFTAKVSEDNRQDVFQDIVAKLLKAMAMHDIPINEIEFFCYALARRVWIDFIRKENRHNRLKNGSFISLNRSVRQTTWTGVLENVEFQETIAGEVEFELKIISELDSQAVFDILPDRVKLIVNKRLERQALTSSERSILFRWGQQDGDKIRELLKT